MRVKKRILRKQLGKVLPELEGRKIEAEALGLGGPGTEGKVWERSP